MSFTEGFDVSSFLSSACRVFSFIIRSLAQAARITVAKRYLIAVTLNFSKRQRLKQETLLGGTGSIAFPICGCGAMRQGMIYWANNGTSTG
jgi:hypothetical protein